MSWNAQSLFNSRPNPAARASGNVFTPSTAALNGSLASGMSTNHRNGTSNQLNQIRSNMTRNVSNPAIPALNASQLRNIDLPELPKELLNPTSNALNNVNAAHSVNTVNSVNAINALNAISSLNAIHSNSSKNIGTIPVQPIRYKVPRFNKSNPINTINAINTNTANANALNALNQLKSLNAVNGLKSLNNGFNSLNAVNPRNNTTNGHSHGANRGITNLLDNFILNGSSANNPNQVNGLTNLKGVFSNGVNGSGATININNVNNINNINHVNINQSGTIHNTLIPNAVSTVNTVNRVNQVNAQINRQVNGQANQVNAQRVNAVTTPSFNVLHRNNAPQSRQLQQSQSSRSHQHVQNARRQKAHELFRHIMGSAIPSKPTQSSHGSQPISRQQSNQSALQSLQRIQDIQQMKGMEGIKTNGSHHRNNTQSRFPNVNNMNGSSHNSHWQHSNPPSAHPQSQSHRGSTGSTQKRIKLKLKRPRFHKMGHSQRTVSNPSNPSNMPPPLPMPEDNMNLPPALNVPQTVKSAVSSLSVPSKITKPVQPSPISVHPLGPAQPAPAISQSVCINNKIEKDLIGSILNGLPADQKGQTDASASTDTDCSNKVTDTTDTVPSPFPAIPSDGDVSVPTKLNLKRTETIRILQNEGETRGDTEETTTKSFDDELLVDVNGVKWDDTVNWVCGVCEGADAQKENALVVCEGCSRAVHQNCYHVPPAQLEGDGDWYCQPCRFKRYILENETLLQKLRGIYGEYVNSSKFQGNDDMKTPLTVGTLLKFAERQSAPSTPPSTASVPHSEDLGTHSVGGFIVSAAEKTRSHRRRRRSSTGTAASPPERNDMNRSNGGAAKTMDGDPMHSVRLPVKVLTDATTTSDTFFDGKPLPKCVLCCTVGGSYKIAADGNWVHVACSTFHPEVVFSKPMHRNLPILSRISAPSRTASCSLCHQSAGACIQCTFKPHCNHWFHITCAQQHRLYLLHDDTANRQSNSALTAYCPEHTRNFKISASAAANTIPRARSRSRNRSKNRVSGRKRKRSEADGDYKPRSQKPKRSRSTRRSKKDKPALKSSRNGNGGKPDRRPFSPDPPFLDQQYMEKTTDEYIQRLLDGEDSERTHSGTPNGTGGGGTKSDDISSVSSQEAAAQRAPVTPPKLKKRRKSAVDMLSHSSFAPKRNKWVFNQIFHLYPPREAFYESKDFEEDIGDDTKGIEPDPNHWTLETTTDPTQLVAEACMRSVETLWTHRQTNLLAKSQNGRDYRKSLGFSILRNPKRDVITSCNWALWEVSATKMAVLIKLFITEPYSKSKIPQRRKKNGTMLAAHVMDIAFRSRDDVDFVVICSERGIAEIFWRALGFTDFTSQEKRSFCRGTEKDLNQFRDTILLRMHHDDYIRKYCDSATEWGEDNCAVQKVFRKWRRKHLFMKRRLVFKLKGKSVHTHSMPSY